MAEKLGIEIRLYSIIYDAINEVKDAMSGMLSPEIKEEVTGSCEVRQVFKISKVGTVAGCFVTDGKIMRTSKVRVIRDGIVIYTGALSSLRKVKDDVKEMTKGFECGLSINNYNDIQEGDIIEAFGRGRLQGVPDECLVLLERPCPRTYKRHLHIMEKLLLHKRPLRPATLGKGTGCGESKGKQQDQSPHDVDDYAFTLSLYPSR